MRISQPDAPNAPVKAATALTLVIQEYQIKADEFHKKALAFRTATLEEKNRLQKEWQEAKEYLDSLRMKIDTLAALEDGLAQYRTELGIYDSEERLAKMRTEKHHPTTVLRKNLIADRDPPPTADHVAHHIIMGKGRWRKREMTRVRLRLFDCNVRINDPRNGVWLHPDVVKHWATPDSPIHNPLHGFNYETWVITNMKLTLADEMFLNALKELKNQLKGGGYPKEILQPKKADWNGL
ncbi:hypothetical protein GNX18_17650 [Microbulbifer sp. SH-1]|uniref:AHH domain-containing protein n=1 Tax=Microbulbifer sp. SH-1 TaxID=2681547 RepID=UPI00140829E7|nr:AHH domain-containing protein [Microbulbifer sp. SH-1]QIL91403.1 hypothetical protein GNX18_17650 [Microbulbifer sp. SH-1]